MNKTLGRLERVELRAVWSSESGDFTPWLAQEENISLLGDTIGIDLQVESTEKYVGPFRADIVCKDTILDSWVLIENQLERTDHSHLGQLLTYAAGLDAVTIVWIAERFTDEHRAALDWLNEVTEKNINFFGLEIELWCIGDSAYAPKFNVVSQPNDWTKTVQSTREAAESGELSSIRLLRLEFWTAFRDYLVEHHSILKSQKPNTDHWTNFAIGRSNFTLSALVGMRDGFLEVNILMRGSYAKAHYNLLALERETIEAEIGAELEWRELPDKKSSDIKIVLPNVDPTNRADWEWQHEWLMKYLEAFYRCFAPRVKRLDAANYIQSGQDNEQV